MGIADRIGAQETRTGMRFGLIGCGGIGRLRAAALSRSAPLRLVAVTDVQPERAAAIASNYGGVIDEDWRGLLRREEMATAIAYSPPSLLAASCFAPPQARNPRLSATPLSPPPAERPRPLSRA